MKKLLKKKLKFLLNFVNKFVGFIYKGKYIYIYIDDRNSELFKWDDIKNFVNHPIKTNYFKKILFIEWQYKNLYKIYKKIKNKLPNSCDYVRIKSERDLINIKKIFDYKIIVVNQEFKFLDKVSKKHQTVICIWHALGAFKKVGKYNNVLYKNQNESNYYESFFDYLIISSTKIIPLYADAFNMQKEKVLALGLPQVDDYFKKEKIETNRQEFLESFPFLKNKKIYGFFPTFQDRTWGTYWKINFKKLASLLKEDEVIVFKIHPAIEIKNTNFCEIKNKIINLSHIENLISVCKFYSILTDYSSIIYEAMIFDINLVFLRNKLIEKDRNIWVKYEKLPGNIININKINQNIENLILEKLREKFNNSKIYKEFFLENVGNCDQQSSDRITEFLVNKLNNKTK